MSRIPDAHRAEVAHWAEVERRSAAGERQFWLSHPRIAHHYHRKALIDGLHWQDWIVRRNGGPLRRALELGCGTGEVLADLLARGVIRSGDGLDLDAARLRARHPAMRFIADDVNTTTLEEGAYDLVYAVQAFHHFDALEHVMAQVHRALAPGGVFVLDEFVGPARFQWTDMQLAWIRRLLGLMPPGLRFYQSGMLKTHEGRSTVEEVIRVCPSEAIRSPEIPTIFASYFRPLAMQSLGGTIQHLLYAGIVQNLPDDDAAVSGMIDAVDEIETALIEQGILGSDFMLLVGTRKP